MVWNLARRLRLKETFELVSKDSYGQLMDVLPVELKSTNVLKRLGVVADADEGANTVRIAGGCVDVTYANCSNQVCVEHDPISQVGEEIVCLPHGMVIEIVASEDDATKLG